MIVVGLGVAGHFGGVGARGVIARSQRTRTPTESPHAALVPLRVSDAKPELVATPVLRIAAPEIPAQRVAKPKVSERPARRADPAAASTSTTTTSSATPSTASATAAAKPIEDDELMRQAAETLSNAQLEGP